MARPSPPLRPVLVAPAPSGPVPAPVRAPRLVSLLVPLGLVLPACEEPLPEGGEVFAQAVIGPDGGMVAGGTVTLEIPPGALTADTEVELRRSDEVDLGLSDYPQVGSGISLFPAELQLELPAALTVATDRARPVVLFEQDGLDVVATGQTAYINEFSRAAAGTVASDDVVPLVTFAQPPLGPSLSDPGAPLVDAFRMELQLSTPSSFNLDVVLSAYDPAGAYDRPLRGTGEGECGFRLLNVTGGSNRADCSDSRFTATIRTAGTGVSFDVEPFLVGSLEVPIAVGVIAGSSEVAFQGGFFGFQSCDGC